MWESKSNSSVIKEQLKDNSMDTTINPNPNPKPKKIYSICNSHSSQIKDIISFLNTTLGSNYKLNSQKTNKLIIARLNKGFTVDNFKTVIQKKFKDWNEDDQMRKYLRPTTIFGAKFEEYLNEMEEKKDNRPRFTTTK